MRARETSNQNGFFADGENFLLDHEQRHLYTEKQPVVRLKCAPACAVAQ